MSETTAPFQPFAAPSEPNPESSHEEMLITRMLPILDAIHRRVLDDLPDVITHETITQSAKSAFEGALYMHDRSRLQDWAGLENHARECAIDAIITLILIDQRRADLSSRLTQTQEDIQ